MLYLILCRLKWVVLHSCQPNTTCLLSMSNGLGQINPPYWQVRLELKDHDKIIKWVRLGLSQLVKYPYLDTTRTRHTNLNSHPCFKHNPIKICFHSASIKRFPYSFLWAFLCMMLAMFLLKILKVLTCQTHDFLHWGNWFIISTIIPSVPQRPANHGKKLRATSTWSCQTK